MADARAVDGDRAGAWKIAERGAPTPRAYIALVRRWMRAVRRVILAAVGPALDEAMADASTEEEEAAIRAARVQARIREALRRARLPAPPVRALEGVVEAAAAKSMRASRRQLIAAGAPRVGLASRLGVDLDLLTGIDIAPSAMEQAVIVAWSRQGTDLIRSVGQDLVAGLDEHVVEAARKGLLTSDLRQVVMERLGVSERHAQFIARDQISKLNGRITEATQRAAWVEEYTWRAVHDERTRPDHAALDMTVQRWDAPPIVDQRTGRRGNPGDDYECRCGAIPRVRWS